MPIDDIKPNWLNIARRLQSVARGQNSGIGIITVHIMVEESGNPIAWTSPDCLRLEPKNGHDIRNLVNSLTESQLSELMQLIAQRK
jgi:hypothetical protein